MAVMRRLIAIAVLVLCGRVAAAETVWEPFALRSFDGREIAGTSTMLAVRERRDDPHSRFIRIAVVRLPSRGAKSRTPTVFLTGGPGIPATGLARVPVYFNLFDSLRDVGDVLLVDQRGSGMSVPNLNCPKTEISRDFASSDDAMRTTLKQMVRQCAEYWRASGVDLAGYTTRELADDVDAARRAVGAKQVKLLAFSYGSEVALDILRRRPATVERAVIASTRGPDALLKMPSVWDRQLDVLGIRDAVSRIVTKLDASPVDVAGFRVAGVGLLTLLRSDLADGRARPKLPALLQQLDAGNYEVLGTRIAQQHAGFQGSFNLMTLAIDCSSGWSDARLASTRAEARAAIMRNVNLQWDPEVCGEVVAERAIPAQLGRIRVPALFITGRFDPQAPPEQTEQLRRAHFLNARQVIVEDAAHETLPDPAVQKQVVAFLRAGGR